MSFEVLRQQLISIQAQTEAALALLDALEPCRHPPERRQDLSTMGCERWLCLECGYRHEQSLKEGE